MYFYQHVGQLSRAGVQFVYHLGSVRMQKRVVQVNTDHNIFFFYCILGNFGLSCMVYVKWFIGTK